MGPLVYWVGGRQFACELTTSPDAKAPYAGRHLLSLKCDPDRILELRAEHPDAVLPGRTETASSGTPSPAKP